MKKRDDLRERTKVFALRIIRLFGSLPKATESQVLGKQLLRSGTSVGANYREAYRARSKIRVRCKMRRFSSGLEETAYWLELIVDGGLVPAGKLQPLQSECDELIAIFVTIIKQARGGAPS
jgi:four helix bundle protein